MANLTARLVVRYRDEQGNRQWAAANGQTDPAGTYYIQHYAGSATRYTCLRGVTSYHDAELALARFCNRLKAGPLPTKPAASGGKHPHRVCIDSYRRWQENSKRKNGRPYTDRSIKERVAVVKRFVKWCPVPHIEDITRKHLIDWTTALYDEGLAQDTVLSKLAIIVRWLRKNQTVEIASPLRSEDWPNRRPSKPRPYSPADISNMMAVAEAMDAEEANGGRYRLMLRVFLATGMRIAEVAHLEAADVEGRKIYVRDKLKTRWRWLPKTVTSVREIPISAALADDLRAFCKSGLIFPSPRTHTPYAQAVYRTLMAIGKAAGVTPPADQPKADWAHRWRDTYATAQVRLIQTGKSQLGLRDVARNLGHANLDMINLYAAYTELDSEEAQHAADLADPYAKRNGKVVSMAAAG